jgi:hypothetical protein
MRATNGRWVNRLPKETAATVGRSVGGAALQAVLIVTAVRVVDAVFQAITDKHRARRAAKAKEPVAA